MLPVYQASTSTEAQMVLDLLERSGIHGIVQGDSLQSGLASLHTVSFVQVLVEDEDVQEAREIVAEWEAKFTAVEEEDNAPQHESRSSSFTSSLVIVALVAGGACLLVGVILSALHYRAPVYEGDSLDKNHDGIVDERWTYKGYYIHKLELDRNFDGDMDHIQLYDSEGIAESAEADHNFDGVFDSRYGFIDGIVSFIFSDADGDGFDEVRHYFEHGGLKKEVILDSDTKKIVKETYYEPFRIERQEIDTTGDGMLDTVREFDAIGEIVREYQKASAN